MGKLCVSFSNSDEDKMTTEMSSLKKSRVDNLGKTNQSKQIQNNVNKFVKEYKCTF